MTKFKLTTLMGVIATTATLGLASNALAKGDPINIGGIYILSGSAASYGEFAKNGIQMAVDEINKSGGVLDRDIAFTLEDSQGKANVGIQAARKLVYQKNVNALVGLDSSGVAVGLVPVLEELKVPLIITHAATPDATGKLCNQYTYRISTNEAQNMRAAAQIAVDSKAKRWTTIGPDYAFGHDSWELFSDYVAGSDIELMSETAFPKFGAEDFTPFINNVMQNDPDGVLISVWGGDLVNFVRQAHNLGFFDKGYTLLFTVGAATEVMTALGDKIPEGVWLGTRYWYGSHDTPKNHEFVENYKKLYNAPPSYNAEGAYSAVYAVRDAIAKAGSAEPGDIAQALKGLEVDTPAGKITFRVGDNQAMVGPTWGKTTSNMTPDGLREITDIINFDGEKVARPLNETDCKL